jgi:transposase
LFQRTHVCDVQIDSVSDASRLLDLGGLAVDRVASDAFGGRVVHMVTADECASACPSCGVLSVSLKGLVCTRPRDIPYGATVLRLIWHKRRWRCKERLCPRASFTESLPAVRARSRLTTRMRVELGCAVAEQGRVVSESAAHYGVDWSIVHNAFVEHVRVPLSAPLPPVKVLGIDETRRGRPVFAQDPDTKRWVLVRDRWHTGFVDAAGTGGLLAQVEGRTSAATIAWLNAQPATWRTGITHVTIDLSASYAKAVRDALPDAMLVADRFHLVALANDMLTQVRQRVIRETEGRRGRKTDPAWAARRRLLTGHERLRPETFARMWNSLIDTGDAGIQILQAYVVKEELRSLLGLAGTNPQRHVIRTRLDNFYQQAAATDAPEAHRLAATIEAWWPAIEAGLLTGYSNSRSEGYNRLAKHQGRNAFGFRNPVNQRRRIRWACTRQYRRASAARSTLPA